VAHLACGVPIAALGRPLAAPLELPTQEPALEADGSLLGVIVLIDRFGNCISNIGAAELARLGAEAALDVQAGGRHLGGIARTYADVAPGEPLALIGSSGALELAVRNSSAAAILGLRVGDTVAVRRITRRY
jgi:S-adenosylmethionine hydrolase